MRHSARVGQRDSQRASARLERAAPLLLPQEGRRPRRTSGWTLCWIETACLLAYVAESRCHKTRRQGGGGGRNVQCTAA